MGSAGVAAGVPPYEVIWYGWKRGLVIPFLGAGASCTGRPPGSAWDPAASAFLPTGSELSLWLAGKTQYPDPEARERSDLAKVCSYYADVNGRRVLRMMLRDILSRKYQPGPLHRFLAEIAEPQVVVVTNYDTLVEQALDDAGKPYDLVVYAAGDGNKEYANSILWKPHGEPAKFLPPKELDVDFDTTTVIFKMHGSIDRENVSGDHFVITEEDYVEFLSRMTTQSAIPAVFYSYFRERSFLFLGYSLRDWNLRVVLRNLSSYFATRSDGADSDDLLPSWAIQRSPSDVERALWKKREVTIFDHDLDEFAARMCEARSQP